MPSERISDGILCLKGQVMSDFLPEFEPCVVVLFIFPSCDLRGNDD
ncbi:Transposase [Neisseria meningitidis]|nr:Transposase [Neisseria meningitidis]